MKTFIDFQKEEVELDEATVGAHQQGWHDAYHTGKPPHQHHTIIYKDKEQRKEYLEGHKEGILARKSDMKEEVELDEVVTPIKNKVQDRKTGKWYDPTKEFNKLMDKPEVKAQMKRMAKADVKEEVELDEEQLDELSPKTLGSYTKKAAVSLAVGGIKMGRDVRPTAVIRDGEKTVTKRIAGINRATDKLTKEESDTPFEGPYKQSKGTVTDKSGAKHTPLSNVRSLARNAIEKMKQKIRMAHLSPEVKAEKLARNEELVGGQKKLDIDKDGKIEKSDLEVIRAKKLKEDVTTATQKLKAALDRHTEHAVAANRAGDHDAVKVHQGYANKIKTQLGKLAKNEEVEQLGESGGPVVYKKGNHHIEKYGEDSFALYKDGKKQRYYTSIENAKSAMDEGHQVVATTKEGETFKSGIHPTKEKALSQYYKMSKSGNYKKIDTIKTEEVEIDEAAPTGIKIYHKGQDDKESHSMVFSAADAAKHEKELKQQGRKVTGRAVMSGKTEGPRKNVTEEVEIDEASMTDAEMAKREKIVKGMKKSFKDFTTKYGDRAKEVMYATATKKAMEEEVEEELEEDMDEGVTTRNGAVTVHKGTYGTSYQPNDDEDDEDTPEKKEPAVKRGRGRPAGAKSGAKPKGSSAGKSYGGVAIHSLRLPNNNK